MKTLQLQRKRDEAWHYVGPRSDLKEPLVLIFGNRFLLEEAATFEEIRKLFPDGHLVFGSSSGDLIADSVNDEHLSVTAIEFERALFEVKTINISTVAYNSELAGREVVSKLNPNGLKHIFVVSEGSSVNGSALTKGMQAAAPKVLITGGLCGDDARFERTLAGYNKPPDDGEIVVIGFYALI